MSKTPNHTPPKIDSKWRHPVLGIGQVTRIAPAGYIHVDYENGMTADYRAAQHFHADKHAEIIDE